MPQRRALRGAASAPGGQGIRGVGIEADPALATGDWRCEACGDHQFARNAQCRLCGAARPPRPPGGRKGWGKAAKCVPGADPGRGQLYDDANRGLIIVFGVVARAIREWRGMENLLRLALDVAVVH